MRDKISWVILLVFAIFLFVIGIEGNLGKALACLLTPSEVQVNGQSGNPVSNTFGNLPGGINNLLPGEPIASIIAKAAGGRPLTPQEKQQVKQGTGGIDQRADGSCPTGYSNIGGVCVPQSVLGQI